MTGGNTLVKGFDHRIKRELTILSPVNTKINVVNSVDAELDAWRGGVLLA